MKENSGRLKCLMAGPFVSLPRISCVRAALSVTKQFVRKCPAFMQDNTAIEARFFPFSRIEHGRAVNFLYGAFRYGQPEVGLLAEHFPKL